MLDTTVFGAELIKDKDEAVKWVSVGVSASVEKGATVRDLFRPEVMAELEKYIDPKVLDQVSLASVFYSEADVDPPKRAEPIDRASVGQAIHDFLAVQAEPMPFRVIKEYVEMNGGFTITQAQWNTLNKKIPGLQMVGERQHARWKIK